MDFFVYSLLLVYSEGHNKIPDMAAETTETYFLRVLKVWKCKINVLVNLASG